ncbi:P-loop containing nucleoside triphosphate hydrolase protein [Mycena pura]|uniref:P-loop containing nucleoside triphosphate hydrolase protein n=1 Tax=Mycena pura TaxID=153505 RepID=A0AAD6VLF9_9AGAR|nr:P-loop containing nucleoside triphosphate hydrolase protein [Mycena pura]
MAAAFSMRILFWYIHIEQESKPTDVGRPPAHWPAAVWGFFRNISFRIKSGERVGVVGRTWSGKSSLTLALLRCVYTDGTVYYDGIETSSPELLSGTLRHNLDPFGQHDDTTLNGALRAAGLFALQEDMEDGRLELDSAIASGEGNVSVWQRQILTLWVSLRNELKPDVTVVTVAHRLQTILDSDKIAEFDVPEKLLNNPMGKLRALVDEFGDKESLYAMANGGRSP